MNPLGRLGDRPILDPAKTSGFTSVERVETGSYCLTAPGLSSDTRPPVTSVDWFFTGPRQATASAMTWPTSACGDSGFRVVTKRTIIIGGELEDYFADDVGFVIAVP